MEARKLSPGKKNVTKKCTKIHCFKNRYKQFAVTVGIYGHLNYLVYKNSISSEPSSLCRLSFPVQINISVCINIHIHIHTHTHCHLEKEKEIIRQYC